MEKTATILNEEGLHARPAGLLVKAMAEFSSDVEIILGEASANAKSIMSIMALGLSKDSVVTIKATGEDEEAAIDKIVDLINNKFEI